MTKYERSQIKAQIRKCERERKRQAKMYEEAAAAALPMAIDRGFCERIMCQTQQAMAQLRKQADNLRRTLNGERVCPTR